MTTLSMDYEAGSEAQLTGQKSVGLDNYMKDFSTRAFLLASTFDDSIDDIDLLDFTDGDRISPELRDALLDPHVIKWAFNAGFERRATIELMGINTPRQGWRCGMALAYMRSFSGGLGDVGKQMGLPDDTQKDGQGKRLINLFCKPQRITKANPHRWRTRHTDPYDWQLFGDYCKQDVTAEVTQRQQLLRFPLSDEEWELYEADQEINDAGLPMNRRFIESAIKMSARRKAELKAEMVELTGLRNPNSGAQLIPWLRERGYPFDDLKKNTVKKVVKGDKLEPILDDEARRCLALREHASKMSVSKYGAFLRRLSDDDNLRHCFQFAGGSRTLRWAGRGPQPHNLVKTPDILQAPGVLETVVDTIAENDYDGLSLLFTEPMDALTGAIRSAIAAPDDHEFVVADLKAIESAVGAWLSGSVNMLKIFKDGLDPYKAFGVAFYNVLYEAITKEMRNICKPPMLGCSFGLGPGREVNGKLTGLLGYAENMGVDLTPAQATRAVHIFRDVLYPEVPACWEELANACDRACRGLETVVQNKLRFSIRSSFMTVELPNGAMRFYHRPKMKVLTFPKRDGSGTFQRNTFTHMGVSQITKRWQRVASGGPKIFENMVQGIAREVLKAGVLESRSRGFDCRGTTHDEIITLRRKGDEEHGTDQLIAAMTTKEKWMKGLPLDAAGFVSALYKKD